MDNRRLTGAGQQEKHKKKQEKDIGRGITARWIIRKGEQEVDRKKSESTKKD